MAITPTTAYLALAAINFTEVVDFYSQLIGQQPSPYVPNTYAEFQLPDLRLAIFLPKPDNYAEFANSAGSGFSICLELTDLDQAIAQIQDMGYQFPRKIMTASHGREIYLYDPAGNRLILHQSVT